MACRRATRHLLAISWCSLATAVPLHARSQVDEPAPPAAADEPAAPAPDEVTPEPAPVRPRGLLGVAEAEAARSAAALRERILVLLRNFSQAQNSAADRGRGFLDNVVLLGPDAVPLLAEVLQGVEQGSYDAAYAGAAARALCGIFERTQDKAILARLGEAVQSGGAALKNGALEGLESLDHPQVIEIVTPLLQHEDPTLRARAVRVLGRQRSSAAGVIERLRPLLQQQGAPWTEAMQALHALGDRGAVDAAQQFVAKSEDSALLLASVRCLADLGGRFAIPPLRSLLLRAGENVPDTLLKQAIDAAQAIGLRESDSRSAAEELLLEASKKLRDGRAGVAEHARWSLGPFGNEETLRGYEDNLDKLIAENRKRSYPNTGLYIELAEHRLQFLAWPKALDALKRAADEDKRENRTSDIEGLRAVAYCGMGKYTNAERILRTLHPDLRRDLFVRYRILDKMAERSDYRDLFPAKGS